jgi:acyl-CoA synthetase (AMP-forming)/AMP-acid ligase II/acyl carrier protein
VVFLGGEPISASRVREWAQSSDCATQLANVYGVAECSDVSSFYRLKDFDRYAETSVPIGKPIFESEIHLVDEDLRPVPPGEVGEICIAGVGVGKGYLNDSSLTDEKFLPNPFRDDPVSQLYRTGDVGRYLPDGHLELLGRLDHQVKIRGHRIDLGDAETSLRLHPDVREAVVVSKPFGVGDIRLRGYVVPRRLTGTEETLFRELRSFLKERLPEYMVPSDFVALDEMPLNPNGKVDRIALVQWESVNRDKAPLDGPRSPLEAAVAEIFAKVLGLWRIGITDNFFDRGGDSYLVTVVLGDLSESLRVNLSIFDFLSGPTVAELAEAIERGAQT